MQAGLLAAAAPANSRRPVSRLRQAASQAATTSGRSVGHVTRAKKFADRQQRTAKSTQP